jgi:hypothetical protein
MKAPVGGGAGSLLEKASEGERLPQIGEPAAEGTVAGAGGKGVPALEKEGHAPLKANGGPLHDAAAKGINVHRSVRIRGLFPKRHKRKDSSGLELPQVFCFRRPGSVDLSCPSL